MFSVYIRQAEKSINVEIGSTILETALTEGIDYPHGCRAGNCSACKSRLHSGDVELSPYSEFALTPEEYSNGFILACRAVPWSDCEVSWCELDDVAVHPIRNIQGHVSSIEKLTSDVVSIKLKIADTQPFEFSAGQFVYLTFQGYPRREYSIASYHDNELEFYIRRIEGGIVSPFVWDFLEVMDVVELEGPHGNMFYREHHEGSVLAIAGGSGLSAIQLIVLQAVQSGKEQNVTLLHGVRTEADVYRAGLFSSLAQEYRNFRYVAVLSESSESSRHPTGYLNEYLRMNVTANRDYIAYLAGPPPMVRSCSEVLMDIGVESANIHADPFITEAEKSN